MMDISYLNKLSSTFLKYATRPIDISEDLINKLNEIVKNQLFSVFRSNGSLRIPNHVIGSLTFPERNVKGEQVIAQLVLFGVPCDDEKKSDEIVLGAAQQTSNGKKVIIIKINEDISFNDLLDALDSGKLQLDIRDNLVHELTHAKDIVEETTHSDPQIYHNLPGEVRAHMGELSRFHLENIKDLMQSGFSFRDAFDKSISEDDVLKDIEQHLTAKNKKTLLKGIWTYIVEHIDM